MTIIYFNKMLYINIIILQDTYTESYSKIFVFFPYFSKQALIRQSHVGWRGVCFRPSNVFQCWHYRYILPACSCYTVQIL